MKQYVAASSILLKSSSQLKNDGLPIRKNIQAYLNYHFGGLKKCLYMSSGFPDHEDALVPLSSARNIHLHIEK